LGAGAPLQVYSTGLHMHLRGQTTRLEVERKGGSPACLLDIPRWDFHWQGSYAFKQTVTVQPGERMKLECTFDNPGAKDVNWGEGTEDEMCIGFVYVTL
jgi:FtsP/CotA-like multicopper oxidase with cupredoxin domain